MTRTSDAGRVPIVCDMSTATDSPVERLEEYRELFARALVARERTETGIRFRFAAGPGVAEQVRDLARREKACCGFADSVVAEHGSEVLWDMSVVDDDLAREVLEEFYESPVTLAAGPSSVFDRLESRGFPRPIVADPAG